MKNISMKTLRDEIIKDIRRVCNNRKVVVAFSGGMDSTLVSILSVEALGKERVELVNVCFGPFTYSDSISKVLEISLKIGKSVRFLDGRKAQWNIWKHGPSCNLCTKKIKFGIISSYAKDKLVLGGANKSDSWGQYGIKVSDNSYSPLFNLTKREISELLRFYGFEPRKIKIGENKSSQGREGCKLKHLLKMMAVPHFHGKATAISNEVLLDFLKLKKIEYSLANVKIIGPLRKNIGLVNVFPHLDGASKAELKSLLTNIDSIDEIYFVEKPIRLFVKTNPGIYADKKSRYWLEKGRLQKEFAAPIEVKWSVSKNNKLRTFHVIQFEEVE